MKIYNIKMYIIVLYISLTRKINKSENKDKATSYTEYEIKMYNQNSDPVYTEAHMQKKKSNKALRTNTISHQTDSYILFYE